MGKGGEGGTDVLGSGAAGVPWLRSDTAGGGGENEIMCLYFSFGAHLDGDGLGSRCLQAEVVLSRCTMSCFH